MKALQKAFISARFLLAFALTITIVLTTAVYAKNTLILFGLCSNEDKNELIVDVLGGHFDDFNDLGVGHIEFDTFNSVQDAYDRIAHHTDCNYYDNIIIIGEGLSSNTIDLNGTEVSTSAFDKGLVADVFHCYKDDGTTIWYEKDILQKLLPYLNKE